MRQFPILFSSWFMTPPFFVALGEPPYVAIAIPVVFTMCVMPRMIFSVHRPDGNGSKVFLVNF